MSIPDSSQPTPTEARWTSTVDDSFDDFLNDSSSSEYSETTEETPGTKEAVNDDSIDSTPESRASSRKQYQETLCTPDEEVLETREKTDCRTLGGGVNVTEFVQLKDDGSAVFKPASGEHGWSTIPSGTLYKRERAAYLVSRFLGFDFVPETTIREIDGQVGSLQRFVPDAITAREARGKACFKNGPAYEQLTDDLKRLWLFDYIIWNCDRNAKNYLIKDDGNIAAIDHGFSFGPDFSGFHPFFDERLPVDAIKNIRALAESDHMRQLLRDLLLELLPAGEVKLVFDRLDVVLAVIENETIPTTSFGDMSYDPMLG